MNAIEIRGLTKSFRGMYAVDHLNMTVPAGSIYGFIGENGSGKSTTMKLLCGHLVADSGEVKLFGKEHTHPGVRVRVGALIEDPGCFPGSSVYQNLVMQCINLGIENRDEEIRRVLEIVRISFVISMLYVGINLWSWHMLGSYWFMVLAVYYVIMAVMRYLLVRYVRIQKIGTDILSEWKRSRICAYILLLINLSLSGAVLMILYQHKGYDYPGIMIYVMAMYTFYSLTMSIVELVKYRSLASPIMSTAKIVSLSAALVSMLNLETAMFAQFGAEMSVEHQHIFIILTGAGVSITVVTLSVILIVRATKEIRREKYGK